jgi:hypothetical protein
MAADAEMQLLGGEFFGKCIYGLNETKKGDEGHGKRESVCVWV